jgi:hypothetical protein
MTFLDDRGRLSAFLSNGGGIITFRIALSAVAGVTLWLLQSFGTHIVGQLDQLARAQSRMATSLATQIQEDADTARLSNRNSDRLDDHEHRITILEARSAR